MILEGARWDLVFDLGAGGVEAHKQIPEPEGICRLTVICKPEEPEFYDLTADGRCVGFRLPRSLCDVLEVGPHPRPGEVFRDLVRQGDNERVKELLREILVAVGVPEVIEHVEVKRPRNRPRRSQGEQWFRRIVLRAECIWCISQGKSRERARAIVGSRHQLSASQVKAVVGALKVPKK